MPHIIVKLWKGRSEEQKNALAHELSEAVKRSLGSHDDTISIAIEEVASENWKSDVYDVDISPKFNDLYKKPAKLD